MLHLKHLFYVTLKVPVVCYAKITGSMLHLQNLNVPILHYTISAVSVLHLKNLFYVTLKAQFYVTLKEPFLCYT